MHNRVLQSSPTAATLNQYRSASSFDGVPPLVSAYDDAGGARVSGKEQGEAAGGKAFGDGRKRDGIGSGNAADGNGNKTRKGAKHSPKRVITTAQMNPVKHIYSSKYRQKQSLQVPNQALDSLPQKQQSFAESVYLDLEEYSSIHKYESISPYHEQFDEDKEYAKFLGHEPTSNNIIGSLGNIHINLEAEQSLTKSRHRAVPKLISYEPSPKPEPQSPADPNDTYNELPEDPLPKVKRIQSSTYEPPAQRNTINKQLSLQPTLSDGNQKYSGEFRRFQVEDEEGRAKGDGKRYSRVMGQGAMAALSLQIFNYCLPELSKHMGNDGHISIVNEFSLQEQEPSHPQTRILTEIEPDWYTKNTVQNSLRLILTRQNKLIDYLKYLSELQLRIKRYKTQKELKAICNRNDKEEEDKSESKKEVTIHYDREHSSSKNEKIKSIENSQPRKIVKQSIPLTKSAAGQSPFSYPKPPTLSDPGKQSQKSKQLNSDFISSLNVFTSSNAKLKQFPQAISEVHSQLDRESELKGSGKGKGRTMRKKVCQSETEVLGVLGLLLVKLADKKCNVYVKQREEEDKRPATNRFDVDTLLSASRLKLKNPVRTPSPSKLNQTDITTSIPIEISKIEFDEYLPSPSSSPSSSRSPKQQKTSSTKVAAHTARIKQLQKMLQSKEKYLFEIKSDYDYVINNYITTIGNLKSKGDGADESGVQNQYGEKGGEREKRRRKMQVEDSASQGGKSNNEQGEVKMSIPIKKEELGEEVVHNSRQSQPMTFQMSKGNESYIEQDQWMGNPTGQPDLQSFLPDFRRSLPQKN